MRVLIIVHGLPPSGLGGTELYADAHARALVCAHHDEVLVLAREADHDLCEYNVRDEQREYRARFINHTFRDIRAFAGTYTNDAIDAIAARTMDDFRPDVAHVHHLTCLSTNIVPLLADRRIPCVLTLHDYWMICHRGQLFDTTLRPCVGLDAGCRRCLGVPASGPAAYAAAGWLRAAERALPVAAARPLRRTAGWLAGLAGASAGASEGDDTREIARRVQHMRRVCDQVTCFIAPSRCMRDRFAAFGVPAGRIVVSECGIDTGASGRRSDQRPSGQLRIGFVGSLMVSKAPHLLIEAFARLPAGRASLHLFGGTVAYHGDDSYSATLAPLLRMPGVHAHGPWPHARIADALGAIDVLVVPSVWPETAGLVVREAFAAGVPVVASRIGGIPESVVDGQNGLLFAPGDVSDLHRVLSRLLDEPELLASLHDQLPVVRTIADDVGAMRTRYLAMQAPRP